MRITDVEAFAIWIPRNGGSDEPGRSPVYSIPDGRHSIKSDMHETLVVRVTTEEGLAGYGEGQSPVSPETPKTIVDNLCRPLLVGADPFDVDYIWQRQFDAMRERGHLTGFYVDALAACDIALWDLMGKATGKPVHKLLGGRFRDRIKLYTGCAGREPDSAADRAEALVAVGYRGLKLSPARDRRKTLAIIAAVRDRVGPDIAVMVDLHTEFDTVEAIKLGRELEKLDVYWLEAPAVPDDMAGHAAVTRALNMNVASAE